ncbi:hypothetical protein ACRALDRAFT_2031867 [Sodiomyces alcalophilus JCM 7366]|uniref:uncharacterized protein n=1 Tax=Sodiomyces alcalophilus JCM 7366 TaxID=591952 RepID=UPI0039B421B3
MLARVVISRIEPQTRIHYERWSLSGREMTGKTSAAQDYCLWRSIKGSGNSWSESFPPTLPVAARIIVVTALTSNTITTHNYLQTSFLYFIHHRHHTGHRLPSRPDTCFREGRKAPAQPHGAGPRAGSSKPTSTALLPTLVRSQEMLDRRCCSGIGTGDKDDNTRTCRRRTFNLKQVRVP